MSKKKILVINDESNLIEVTRMILESEGYNVSIAYGGQRGIEMAIKTQPDLILLDWVMPDLNGGEVFRRLHADAITASIPVVLMSALSEAKDEGRILRVDGFLSKPFNVDKLLNTLKSVLGKAKKAA